MKSGIYIILNTVNSKFYLGSASNIARRWKNHRQSLNDNSHYNVHLQRAWNKYGSNEFMFIVIEHVECDKDKLLERENYWIAALDACDENIGYNKRLIAESNLGVKFSMAARQNMSKAFKGRKLSEENKRQISLTLTGRKMSDEAKLNM